MGLRKQMLLLCFLGKFTKINIFICKTLKENTSEWSKFSTTNWMHLTSVCSRSGATVLHGMHEKPSVSSQCTKVHLRLHQNFRLWSSGLTPCRLVYGYRCSGGIGCLYLQGPCVNTGGVSMFFQNLGIRLQDYTMSQPRKSQTEQLPPGPVSHYI
jgi:hypothetical protein